MMQRNKKTSPFRLLARLAAPAALLAMACSPGLDDDGDGGGGGSNNDKGTSGEDGPGTVNLDPDDPGGDGGESLSGLCGGDEKDADGIPPDILILLDRSGSMVENNVESGTNSRWVEATEALSAALRETQGGISWGLKLYPDDDWCGVSVGANVDVATGNAEAIIERYQMSPPVAGLTHTPTRAAVEQGLAYLQTRPPENPKAIVLVTDGEPNCMAPWDTDGVQNDNDGSRDEVAPIQAAADAAAAGIPVYVVGFSISKENTAAALNDIAAAGGKAKDNPFNKYYTAENAAEFQAAMKEISSDASSCTFELTDRPAGKEVTIYLYDPVTDAGEAIPEDPSMVDGWAFSDESTIEIYGPSCDLVLNSWDRVLKSGYGCSVVK